MVKKTAALLLMLCAISLPLWSQADTTSGLWGEFNAGLGSCKDGQGGYLCRLAWQNQGRVLSAHYLGFDYDWKVDMSFSLSPPEPDYKRGRVAGVQYGISLGNKTIRFRPAIGLSYVEMYASSGIDQYDEKVYKWVKTAGIPLSADLDFLIFKFIGIKTSLYLNANPKQPIVMFNAGVLLGKLR
jgi:hypothetical protein